MATWSEGGQAAQEERRAGLIATVTALGVAGAALTWIAFDLPLNLNGNRAVELLLIGAQPLAALLVGAAFARMPRPSSRSAGVAQALGALVAIGAAVGALAAAIGIATGALYVRRDLHDIPGNAIGGALVGVFVALVYVPAVSLVLSAAATGPSSIGWLERARRRGVWRATLTAIALASLIFHALHPRVYTYPEPLVASEPRLWLSTLLCALTVAALAVITACDTASSTGGSERQREQGSPLDGFIVRDVVALGVSALALVGHFELVQKVLEDPNWSLNF